MSQFQVTLFGEIKLTTAEGGESIALPAKGLELFILLLLNKDKRFHRDLLAAKLWPEASSTSAAKYLRHLLWQLQSELDVGPELPLLHHDGRWLQLNPELNIWTDAGELAAAFSKLRNCSGEELSTAQYQTASQAVAHYRGEMLPGWHQAWSLVERERHRSFYLALVDRLMNYCLANGRFDEGIQYGLSMLQHDITREKTHRKLMRLHYLAGDRSSALRQYERCCEITQREFQVPPTTITRRLYTQILFEQIGAAPEIEPPIPAAHTNHLHAELNQIKSFLHVIQQGLAELKQNQQQNSA